MVASYLAFTTSLILSFLLMGVALIFPEYYESIFFAVGGWLMYFFSVIGIGYTMYKSGGWS